jgi:hypothetical protein
VNLISTIAYCYDGLDYSNSHINISTVFNCIVHVYRYLCGSALLCSSITIISVYLCKSRSF